MLGFGVSVTAPILSGNIIDGLSAGVPAFSMPRSGVITSLAAFFTLALGLSLPLSTVTVSAVVYAAPAASNTFTPLSGASLALSPSLTGVITTGTALSGQVDGLNIPVAAGTRLLLALVAAITSGPDLVAILTGLGGGGLGIS